MKYVLNYIAASGNPDKMRLLYQRSKGAFLSAKAVMLLNEHLNVNFKMPVGEEEIEMCVAMEQLKAEWTAEARAEGRAVEREVNALNALRLKLSFEEVSKITGLSIDRIANLANGIGLGGYAEG